MRGERPLIRRFAPPSPTRGEGRRATSDSNFKRHRGCDSTISRHEMPEACVTFTLHGSRGRREDRVRAAPAVSCARCTRKCAHEHTGSAGASRPSLRNGFTAYSVLSSATGFVAPVASRAVPQNLTPASGRQNHTTSPYAPCAFVFRTRRVHRIPSHVS